MKLTAVCIVLAGLIGSCASGLGPKYAAVVLEQPFPVPVAEMNGSPADLGAAQARQLGGPIRSLFHDYFSHYFSSEFEKNLSLTAASAFFSHVSPDHLAEIRALATGLGLDQREVLLGQCF